MPSLQDCWFWRDVASPWTTTAVGKNLPLVVRVDDVPKRLLDWPHRHTDFFALYVVRQGRGTHQIDGVSYGVSRGDVYVMGQGATHTYSRCEDLFSDALYFAPDVFDAPTWDILRATPGFLSLFVQDGPPAPNSGGVGESPCLTLVPPELGVRGPSAENGARWLHLTPSAHDSVQAELAELRAEWEAGTPGGTLLAHALFLRLLLHLARLHAAAHPVPDGPPCAAREETVAAAVRYLDARYAQPVRMTTLAASVFLSPDRFTEVFAAAMGRTPRDYLRHLRIEAAKRLLTTTDLPIAEIAAQSGFGESAYFARAFKAVTGQTPRSYRRGSG